MGNLKWVNYPVKESESDKKNKDFSLVFDALFCLSIDQSAELMGI